jgi:anaerobic selenocysteine-containing dehydrogenase
MTPTAALADVVLPAATHFEFNDIGHYGLGHGYLLARPKVVNPPEECWPDIKILNKLGEALASPDSWYADEGALLDAILAPAGLNFDQFAKRGYLQGPDQFRKYETSGFKTPSGKVELSLSQAEKLQIRPLPGFNGLPEPEDPAFPLVLTSAKSIYCLHSAYRWLEKLIKNIRTHSHGSIRKRRTHMVSGKGTKSLSKPAALASFSLPG